MKLSSAQMESIAKYKKCAAHYDQTCSRTQGIRHRAIDLLQLKLGDVVLDVGCGTGLSFEPLLQRVGASGQVLAFEQSPDMFELALKRIQTHGWRNVHLLHMDAEHYRLPATLRAPDAVLMHYVHDVCRSRGAIDHLFSQLRSGTRISLAGMKNFSGVLRVLNWWAYMKNRPYNAYAHDMDSPWDKVLAYAPSLQVTQTQWGMGYLAHGQTEPEAHALSNDQCRACVPEAVAIVR
jgi:arsenite methyltransferase